jgi:hypothetical protein
MSASPFRKLDLQVRKMGNCCRLQKAILTFSSPFDRGLQYQQNIKGRRIGLIVIRAKSNRLADLRPHAPECLVALQTINPEQIIQVG